MFAAMAAGLTIQGQQQTLTLKNVLDLADVSSPLLRASEAQIEVARAGVVGARTYFNPEVNFLLGNQQIRLPTSVPGFLQHYGFSQRIELPAVRQARIRAARLGEEGARFALAETRLEFRSAVKQAFYRVLRRESELELAQEDVNFARDLQRRIEVQVTAGEAARLELTRAQAEVVNVRTLVKNAELRLSSAKSELRAAAGESIQLNTELVGATAPRMTLAPLDELRVKVLASHPSIAQADSEVKRAEEVLKTEKALRVPQPSFVAEYEQQPDLRFYRLGFALPVPLWDKRKGPIGEATARVNQASAIARQERIEISAALESAYAQYEISDQQVESFRNGALLSARAALQAAQAAYRFGERSIIEVLDAQRVLHSVTSDSITAEFDRQQALIELEQLHAIEPQGGQ